MVLEWQSAGFLLSHFTEFIERENPFFTKTRFTRPELLTIFTKSRIFSFEKSKYTRKMKNHQLETRIASFLKEDPEAYQPIRIVDVEFDPGQASFPGDIRLVLGFPGGVENVFSVECIGDGSPRGVRNALAHRANRARSQSKSMLAVPYISDRVTDILQEMASKWSAVAVIDASGNYFIVQPDVIAIRVDRENRHPQSRGIKKIFQGKSSLVSRLLLCKPQRSANGEWEQVSELRGAIERLGGEISLPTVSKVLKRLESLVLIQRDSNSIRLVEPAKVLDKLRENYTSPQPVSECRLKLPSEVREEQTARLDELFDEWVWTGESCGSVYTAAPPSRPTSIYTKEPIRDRSEIDELQDDRFYNCHVKQIDDVLPFFNNCGRDASELQTYLELAHLGKRERGIARSLRERILERF